MKKPLELATDVSVVAFDPGQITGFYRYGLSMSHTLSFDEMLALAAGSRIEWYYNVDVWVIERFSLYGHKATAKTTSDFPECQVIGMLKVIAKRFKIPQIVFQSASEAKGLVDDERLKAMGVVARTPHEKDAARHALYYLHKRQQEQQKEARHAKR